MSQSEIELWLTGGSIVILLILSAFLSGSETALTATSRARMLRMQQEGSRRAGWVTYLLDQQERLLGAILLGNNLVNILASVLATSVFLRLFGETGVVYATLIMTLLVVVFRPNRAARCRPIAYSGRRAGTFHQAVAAYFAHNFARRGVYRGQCRQPVAGARRIARRYRPAP